jgi:hypothetical protein
MSFCPFLVLFKTSSDHFPIVEERMLDFQRLSREAPMILLFDGIRAVPADDKSGVSPRCVAAAGKPTSKSQGADCGAISESIGPIAWRSSGIMRPAPETHITDRRGEIHSFQGFRFQVRLYERPMVIPEMFSV